MKPFIKWHALILILIPVFSGCTGSFANTLETESKESVSADYEELLFDTDYVHKIDICIDEADWKALLEDPLQKTRYRADTVIDGETVKDVSFSTKGNSSLAFVAAESDQTKYSFKIRFGTYVDEQTYHGLDRLNLNNCFCDIPMMKDYFSYQMFRKVGVPAPLTSFVWLTINGQDQGLYLAVEELDESFLNRTYEGNGVIYKPESKGLGLTIEDVEDIKMNGLPMSKNAKGADLVYVDDDPASYPDIFENRETDGNEADAMAVIAAIKNLSKETNLNKALDTHEIIRYFAVHNFVLNYDSYTGAMLHNIVLYENDGRLGMIPWDYNLAFATFIPGTGKEVLADATDIVNRGIDTPLLGSDEEKRPLWKWIMHDNAYKQEYYDVLAALTSEYFDSGEFEQETEMMYQMLLPYAEADPNSFYSSEEFKNGCQVFRQFCLRRNESVRKQLEGQLDTRSDKQEDSAKVNASDLNIIDMGAFIASAR